MGKMAGIEKGLQAQRKPAESIALPILSYVAAIQTKINLKEAV